MLPPGSNQVHKRAPIFFIGHGSPMNALANNLYTNALRKIGEDYPSPAAVLCISAHWMTDGIFVTAMEQPKTIHDFYGFPPELFAIQYPAKGETALAEQISEKFAVKKDLGNWGLDHGSWSVLRHIYPKANIPVLQLSLDETKSASQHYQLGKLIASLRDQGVMIIGSGNIVHNLRKISWETDAPAFDWALNFDEFVKTKIIERDFESLFDDALQTDAARLSVPTAEHYYPMLYVLGAASTTDRLNFIFEGMQNASISMRSFSFSD